ncbi:hypothetical protein ACHAWF_008030 [Thalassiosira exigua]
MCPSSSPINGNSVHGIIRRAATAINCRPYSRPLLWPRLPTAASTPETLAIPGPSPLRPVTRFERKYYFYPDSPLGYQLTRQRWPLAVEGEVVEKMKKNKKIEHIQLVQDTWKTASHVKNDDLGRAVTESCVDYSCACRTLIEIVSYPDLHSGHAYDCSYAV